MSGRRAGQPRRWFLAALSGASMAALVMAPTLAWGVRFNLSPVAGVGVTNNAVGGTSDNSRLEAFTTLGIGAQLQLTQPMGRQSLSYGFRTTRYFTTADADSNAHDAAWAAELTPTARSTLGLNLRASLFTASSVAPVDPRIGSTTVTAVSGVRLLSLGTGQAFTYQPNGTVSYSQSLAATYVRSLGEGGTVPGTLQILVGGAGSRIYGLRSFSLNFALSTSYFVGSAAVPAAAFGTGTVLTAQVRAGWRQEFSPTFTTDVQAGPLFIYSVRYNRGALGPGVIATATYTRAPWFATLSVSQQPVVNPFLSDTVIGDSVALRLTLPLGARERLTLSGLGGYTYTRAVSSSGSFLQTGRAYDLLTVGGSLAYRFERAPIFVSLDYTAATQRGSKMDGRIIPDTLRRVLWLTVGAAFSWGEGGRGFLGAGQ